MQQFTPYFPGYENPNQQQQQQQQQQGQDQQQQQQPLSLNGANLAIYTPAAIMQPLSVLAAQREKQQQQQQHQHQAQQQQHQQQQQQQQVAASASTIADNMVDIGAHGKPKRKQVKNACVNCQKACKKCDIGRPCQRCIKYGLTDTCINSVRKERKKGVKRGPYKKRNKSGGDSGESSGASTPNMTSPMSNNMYAAQNTAASVVNGGARTPTTAMPMHYSPFPNQGHYDPYAYANSSQMMPQAYMVPAAIQQMYPTNPPVLSYQAAMNMISPQQQQQQQGAYMQQQQQQQQQQHQQSPVTSNTSTPTITATTATAAATATTATTSEGGDANKASAATDDDDDEGSKLTILSQLCSAVLDRNDTPKDENVIKTEESVNTPPPSRPHSRETSHQQDVAVNEQQWAANEQQDYNQQS